MNDPLFYVTCPTCEHPLRFEDETQIGQIVPCPKCGSMVFVQRPETESEETEPEIAPASEKADSAAAGVSSSFSSGGTTSSGEAGQSAGGVSAESAIASQVPTGTAGPAAGAMEKTTVAAGRGGTSEIPAASGSSEASRTPSMATKSPSTGSQSSGVKLPPVVRKPIPPQKPTVAPESVAALSLPDDATLYAGFGAETATSPLDAVSSEEVQLDAERARVATGIPLPFGLGDEMTMPKMLALMGVLALLVALVVGLPLYFLLGRGASHTKETPEQLALQVPVETTEETDTQKDEPVAQVPSNETPAKDASAKKGEKKASTGKPDSPQTGTESKTEPGSEKPSTGEPATETEATGKSADEKHEALPDDGSAPMQSELGELLNEEEPASDGSDAELTEPAEGADSDVAEGKDAPTTEKPATGKTEGTAGEAVKAADSETGEKATLGADEALHDEKLEFKRKSKASAFDFQNDEETNDETEGNDAEDGGSSEDEPTAFDEEADASKAGKRTRKVENAEAEDGTPETDEEAGTEPNTIVVVEARGAEYLTEETAKKLAVPLHSISIQNKPLSGVIRFVSQASGVTIRANWDQLKKLGVSASVPVRLELSDVTARDVLESVLAENGLGVMQNGAMLKVVGQDVTAVLRDAAEKKARLTATKLDLSDLVRTISDSGTTGDLIKLIKTFVHPGMWDDLGGPGKITSKNASRVQFRQYPSVMAEVEMFCDKLRHVRGLPKKYELRIDPPRGCMDGTALCDSMIETRWERTKKLRSQKVSCDFSDGITLEKALQEIFKQVDAQLILEPNALARVSVASLIPDADMPDYSGKVAELPRSVLEMTITDRFSDITVQAAVERVLKDFQPLICYAVAEDAFFLTTKASAERKLIVEFFPVGDIFAKATDAAPFIEQMQAKIFPKTWAKNGGQGVVYYDASSKTLIVLQNPIAMGILEQAVDGYRTQQEQGSSKKRKGK